MMSQQHTNIIQTNWELSDSTQAFAFLHPCDQGQGHMGMYQNAEFSCIYHHTKFQSK